MPIKKRWLALLLLVALIGYVLYASSQLPPSHDTPFATVATQPVPDEPLRQRLILWGDGGESTLQPWQPSMQMARDLAAEAPERTTMVALGDNIYYFGYPTLEQDQTTFDAEQLEDIGHLEAQLKVAADSGAALVMVPGNHDWYAGQTDDQAKFIADYGRRFEADVALRPWVEAGAAPMPDLMHLDGITLLLLDSQWMITADAAGLAMMRDAVRAKLAQVPAGDILVVAKHHPVETMGPHARFYSSLVYRWVMAVIEMIWGNDQDLDTPPYRDYMDALAQAFDGYQGRVVFAAGHDHSLQVFGGRDQPVPQYRLVSGAANTSKVSGVGSNRNTLFAVSREGFMSLELYSQGVWLRVWTIDDLSPAFSYRLW